MIQCEYGQSAKYMMLQRVKDIDLMIQRECDDPVIEVPLYNYEFVSDHKKLNGNTCNGTECIEILGWASATSASCDTDTETNKKPSSISTKRTTTTTNGIQ